MLEEKLHKRLTALKMKQINMTNGIILTAIIRDMVDHGYNRIRVSVSPVFINVMIGTCMFPS